MNAVFIITFSLSIHERHQCATKVKACKPTQRNRRHIKRNCLPLYTDFYYLTKDIRSNLSQANIDETNIYSYMTLL